MVHCMIIKCHTAENPIKVSGIAVDFEIIAPNIVEPRTGFSGQWGVMEVCN